MNTLTQQLAATTHAFRWRYLSCRYLLCALCLLLFAVLVYTLVTGVNVQTSLQSMLPQDAQQRVSRLVADRLLAQGERLAFVLIEADTQAQLLSSVSTVKNKVEVATYLHLNTLALEELAASSSLLETLQAAQFNFLSREHLSLLQRNDISSIVNNAAASLFDIASSASVLAATDDPLGLFNDWFTQAYLPAKAFSVEDGVLFLDTNAELRPAAMFVLNLSGDGLSSAVQQDVSVFYQALLAELPDTITVTRSGMVFHSAATAAKAKMEMSMISLVSILGILCLFLFAFRSLKAIAVSVSAILFGCFSGALLAHFCFGQLHIFTLVFGAALIGVAVDYAFHYMAHYFYKAPGVSGLDALASIFPELLAGLMTSLLGFGCLLLSNLPGLDQIAVFSMVGLVSSWLVVVVLFPAVTTRLSDKSVEHRFMALLRVCCTPMRVVEYILRYRASRFLAVVFMVAGVYGVSTIDVDSDLRSLNASPPALIAEEQYLRKRLDLTISNQFFIVRADSAEQLLQSEERLLQALSLAKQDGQVRSFEAVSQLLPSIQRQRQNYQLYQQTLIDEPGALRTFMLQMGFSAHSVNDVHQRFKLAEDSSLTPERWLAIPNLPQSSRLWLGQVDGRYTSVVMLAGVAAKHDLRTIAERDKRWLFVDKIDEISAGLNQQRQQASWLLGMAYLIICLFLGFRFGFLSSLRLISIPLLSTFCTLAVFSALGVSLSVFHVFGLFLVLGLAMDYGIFLLRRNQTCSRISLVAILLSAITSCLSFGLLAVSSIPMIAAFGLTILLGSLFNWLFVSVLIPSNAVLLER